jgi:hypothetical protein
MTDDNRPKEGWLAQAEMIQDLLDVYRRMEDETEKMVKGFSYKPTDHVRFDVVSFIRRAVVDAKREQWERCVDEINDLDLPYRSADKVAKALGRVKP